MATREAFVPAAPLPRRWVALRGGGRVAGARPPPLLSPPTRGAARGRAVAAPPPLRMGAPDERPRSSRPTGGDEDAALAAALDAKVRALFGPNGGGGGGGGEDGGGGPSAAQVEAREVASAWVVVWSVVGVSVVAGALFTALWASGAVHGAGMERLRPYSSAARQQQQEQRADPDVRPKKVGRLAPGEEPSDYVPPYVDPDALLQEEAARYDKGMTPVDGRRR